jgi:hypothetical protein
MRGQNRGPRATTLDRLALLAASVVYAIGVALVLTRPPTANAGAETAATAVTSISSAPGRAPAAAEPAPTDLAQTTALRRHQATFELEPGAGIEFKYRLDKGAAMVYAWTATGPVKYEFHGEPDGARPGYADTYNSGEDHAGRGGFVAPTRGIHGWYWENGGTAAVSVSLESAGFYTAAIEFTPMGPLERPLDR